MQLTPDQDRILEFVGMLASNIARDELSVSIALHAQGISWIEASHWAPAVIDADARMKAGLWPFYDGTKSVPSNLDNTIAEVEREIGRHAQHYGERSKWINALYHLRHYRMKITHGRLAA